MVKKESKEPQMVKLAGESMDIISGQVEKLRTLFPGAVKDGKVDFEALKLTLGGDIDANGQRYGLSWAGKADCFGHIQQATSATLKPCKEESVDFDNTENLFIEGDNLEVLKVLQKSYYGRVKMIYIDPPYNTGNDSFIYPDRFKESKEEYLQRVGEKDVEGNLMKDGFFRKNSKDAGHFHSNWLSMMYPRLFLARNLLKDDGVIFVSIDDNEVHNLKMVMNEIFGEENFVALLIWNSEGHTDNQYDVKVNHEYILIYGRDSQALELGYVVDPNTREESNLWKGLAENSITKNGSGNPPSQVTLPKGFPVKVDNLLLPANEPSSDFYDRISQTGYITRQMTKDYSVSYPIRKDEMNATGCKLIKSCRVFSGWANVNKLKSFIDNDCKPLSEENGDIVEFFLSENGVIYYRRNRSKARNILSVLKNMGTTEQMRSELEKMGVVFQYPKPTALLVYFIKIGLINNDGLILDFFAGSCTTAHAVMQLNAEDGGNRKCICIQLPEVCDEKSEAYKAGYKTIADIGKERIRRAGKKIKEETNGKLDFDGGKLDLGFKVFKLDESNFKQWRENIDTAEQLEKQMFSFIDNVKPDVLQENILYELILKTGLNLNVKVEAQKANGKQYYIIDGDELIICLEEKITKGLIEKITKTKPQKFLCLDRAFGNNDQLKTNTALQMEAEKIEFKVI